MKPPSKRRGFPALLSAGRAFWIALAASLALHIFWLAEGRFLMPQWEESTTLEARLENAPTPAPPQPPLKPAAAQKPLARTPAARIETTASNPSVSEPTIPLSTTPPPSQLDQPYAALIQAAENIRQLPAHIQIVYELNGMLSGRQTHTWKISGERYTLETEGQVTGLAGLFVRSKLVQKSSGHIGPFGLMPEQYEMQHLSGKKEMLRFDYQANLIESTRIDASHGTRILELPLMTSVQDPLSSIYQLAMAAQGGRDGLIVAASSKKVKGYPYRMLGAETLRTRLGEMKTLHVMRAGDSEKSGTHLWLAPAQHSLPVKVVYVDEDGTEWALEAVSIGTL